MQFFSYFLSLMEETPSPSRKVDKALILAIIAVVINVITVSVYLYQSRIMREQQYASAWPYLEWQSLYNQVDGYSLVVRNNGVGPAIIKDVLIKVDGSEMNDLQEVFDVVLGTSTYPYLLGQLNNRVLPGWRIGAYDEN